MPNKSKSQLLWIIISIITLVCLVIGIVLWSQQPSKIRTLQKAESVIKTSSSKNEIQIKPVPQNEIQAKEELDKLIDIQKQLNIQKNILKEQDINADKIIILKEQQIKLLEEKINAQ